MPIVPIFIVIVATLPSTVAIVAANTTYIPTLLQVNNYWRKNELLAEHVSFATLSSKHRYQCQLQWENEIIYPFKTLLQLFACWYDGCE
jgi:hypothetical protein